MNTATNIIAATIIILPLKTFAQDSIRSVSPACESDNFVCVDFDFYTVPSPVYSGRYADHLYQNELMRYEYRIADDVVTLDEITAPEIGPISYDDRGVRLKRERWLSLNGYNTNIDGNSIIPRGVITLAVASRIDPPLPSTSTKCDGNEPHPQCTRMGSMGVYPGQTVVAVSDLMIFRDYPNFDEWLLLNGLQDSGVTINSAVDIGEFYEFILYLQ